MANKNIGVVEGSWRQARELVKAQGNKGKYDLVLKCCLDMLKIKHCLKDDRTVSIIGVEGTIKNTSSEWCEIESFNQKGERVVDVMPLFCLAFSGL